MPRTLEVFEHQSIPVAATGNAVRPSELEVFDRFNKRHGAEYFVVGHNKLTSTEFVGYVEIDDLSIEVLPKADKHSHESAHVWRAGLLDMLNVALGLRLHQLSDGAQQVARGRLLELIARAFLRELEVLLREGLGKGYRSIESNGSVFRGRLKIAAHIRENVARADRFFVQYQTFDHEIVINQILTAALEHLSWCALSASTGGAVDACLSRFPELQRIIATPELVDRVRLTRATQRYERALVYARMILAHQSPQLVRGERRVFALLFDMNKLWEIYVATLLRRIAPSHVRIATQKQVTLWTSDAQAGKAKRDVYPDIFVERLDGQTASNLVIDTKWKVSTSPSDDDLKQMFVYNELLGCQRAVLLYPRTPSSSSASGVFATKSHRCEQFHVGVTDGTKWSSEIIRARLGELLG